MGAAHELNDSPGAGQETAPTLLLADDTTVTVEIERAYFASVGFKVLVASSPAQVEEMVRDNPVDLLMIDVNFAREQGLATVKAARRATCNPRMKVLVTSILASPQLRKKAESDGADEFLVKPAPRPKVLKEIKKLTSQQTRGNERIRQALEVACRVAGGQGAQGAQGFTATTLDLSSDGMHLVAREADGSALRPAAGTVIVVELRLGRNEKPLLLEGEVVRHTQEGFGVRFGDIGKNARRALDKFLLRFSMEHRASQYYL